MPDFKKILELLPILAGAIIFPCKLMVYAQDEALPRNVRLEVEFKEYGESKKGVLSGTWRESKSSEQTKQFIVVSDRLSASIWVGQTVPYLSYYREYLYAHSYIKEELILILKEVGTKLKITPKIIANLVEITLTPQISFIADKERGTIDIKTLTTTVIVQDGHSISIGGLQKDAEFEKYFFKSSSQANLNIILTPHIE